MEIARKNIGKDHPAYSESLNNLAIRCHVDGDYAQAEPLYRQTIEIRRNVYGENHPAYAISLSNLAALYCDQADYRRAEPLLHRAVEVLKNAFGEDDRNYAIGLNNLAEFYKAQGDYARAEPLYYRTTQIYRTINMHQPRYALSLNNLATLHEAQGDHARAESLFRQALEIQKQVMGEDGPEYAQTLNNLAKLYHAQGDYARAEPRFQQSVEIFKKTFGENHPRYAASLNNLAALYEAQGDYARAEPFYRQALGIRKKALGENHVDFAQSLYGLANLYNDRNDSSQAEPLYRQALAIIRKQIEAGAAVQSDRQQLAMLQSVRFYLDSYLAMAVRSGRFTEPAYREMLAWKGMVLRRQRLYRAAAENPELLAIFNQLQRVATQLTRLAWAAPDPTQEADWRQRGAQLSVEKERLEVELSSRSAAYRQAERQTTLEELRSALPPDTVLVDFLEYWHAISSDKKVGKKSTSERRLLAFVAGHDLAVQLVPLGAVPPISEAIDTWRETFGMSPQGRAAGRLLRERIWEPIESKLHGAKIVLVSPDGVLGRLPLGALPGKEPGKYLLEEHLIVIVPVPQLIPELVQEEGRKQLKKNLLLLGNVDYDAVPGKEAPSPPAPLPKGEGRLETAPKKSSRAMVGTAAHFDPLAGTEDEIATIEKLYRHDFGGEGVAKLDRSRATKRAFLAEAGQYRYLHVATHGFFAPESQRSALAVSAEGPSRFAEMRRATRVSRSPACIRACSPASPWPEQTAPAPKRSPTTRRPTTASSPPRRSAA